MGLQKIGQYYHMTETINPAEAELATSPLSADANGECQQNFVIMFTDAAYNGTSAGVGNVDKDYPAPYGDNASNTLADVAMYYWENDLAPLVANNVPTNFYDSAIWQHMVTYTVTFGVEGNMDPDDYDLYNIDPGQRVYPTWPNAVNDDKEKLDDMWHAAINGRGKYFSAKNPQEVVKAFDEIINDVLSRIGSGASVSINGEELSSESILTSRVTRRTAGPAM
jgi:type IV pilus assembly protein PilY1